MLPDSIAFSNEHTPDHMVPVVIIFVNTAVILFKIVFILLQLIEKRFPSFRRYLDWDGEAHYFFFIYLEIAFRFQPFQRIFNNLISDATYCFSIFLGPFLETF